MGYVNKVFLMGNLTFDPDLRYTKNETAVCEIGIAVNRKYKDKEETTFVSVTIWGKRGEAVAQYLERGDPIFIEGYLQLDEWEGKGGKRQKLKAVAEDFQFVGGKGEQKPKPKRKVKREEPTEDSISDDDIPF